MLRPLTCKRKHCLTEAQLHLYYRHCTHDPRELLYGSHIFGACDLAEHDFDQNWTSGNRCLVFVRTFFDPTQHGWSLETDRHCDIHSADADFSTVWRGSDPNLSNHMQEINTVHEIGNGSNEAVSFKTFDSGRP